MTYPTDLNELAQIVHQANIKWWQNIDTGEPIQRSRCELLALIISELCECLEGERRNLMDDKLPHRKMAEVELADAKIRILDFTAGFGIYLNPFISSNDVIPDNKGEALFGIMDSVCDCFDCSKSDFWLTGVILQIDAYAEKHDYDIDGAFAEKMAYNATREDHKHEARKIAGGKQF